MSVVDAIEPSVEVARTWVARRLRAGLSGGQGAGRRTEILASEGERWFEPGSPITVVHADSAMFVGGLRALLLQSLHPLAMAGIADHSNYRDDPWGRLRRTGEFLGATTFGTAEQAESAVAIVRRVHERVVGTAPDGRPYAANDPHLLRWVHVTEVDSFLTAHDRYGVTRLTNAQRDEYVAQTAVVARALGVAAPPESVHGLAEQLRMFRPEIEGTPAARDIARYLLWPSPMSPAIRPAYGLLAATSVSLLPRWARRPLRLPWFPVTETLAVRPAGEALTRTLRWVLQPEPA